MDWMKIIRYLLIRKEGRKERRKLKKKGDMCNEQIIYETGKTSRQRGVKNGK